MELCARSETCFRGITDSDSMTLTGWGVWHWLVVVDRGASLIRCFLWLDVSICFSPSKHRCLWRRFNMSCQPLCTGSQTRQLSWLMCDAQETLNDNLHCIRALSMVWEKDQSLNMARLFWMNQRGFFPDKRVHSTREVYLINERYEAVI